MGQELQIPQSFQNKGMAKVFQGRVSVEDDKLSDGIAQGFPVMHYKGKIWALKYRGDRKVITRKDDGTPSGHLDVVILKQAKGKSKQFYKGAYDPNSSEGMPPTCTSMDGIVPDAGVPERQSEACALCPRNVWKADANGRRGRECSDRKRLAILVMPNQTEPLFGKPVLDPILLDVPPDSMQSLAQMGDSMVHQGFHYSTYLARITFDPNKAHPSLVFRPIRPLEDAEGEAIIKLQEDPSIPRIIGLAENGAAPAQPGTMRLVNQPVATAAVTKPALPETPSVEQAEQVEEAPSLGALVAATKATAAPAAPKRPRGPNKPKPAPEPAQGVLGLTNGFAHGGDPDAGPNDDSGVSSTDDDLDAEIASLIKA